MSKLVSVIMPIYNGEKFLEQSLNSILLQTYKNLEIIAINDGSTDGSLSILERKKDRRIKIINNPENMKLVRTLNRGIEQAEGDYIARMDSDDIAHPNRIQYQIEHMLKKPELGVLGTWFEFMGLNTIVKFPKLHEDIQSRLFYNNAIGHPTAMINRKVVGENFFYSIDYEYAEDYELWNRLARLYPIENLDRNLLQYRVHEGQISSRLMAPQNDAVEMIRAENLRSLGLEGNVEELQLLKLLFANTTKVPCEGQLHAFATLLVEKNNLYCVYPAENFQKYIQSALERHLPSIFVKKSFLKHAAFTAKQKIFSGLFGQKGS